MRKKGFTLVELLAVIAILAILVIIAMPNVLDMFNKAKQDAFETEVRSHIKVVNSEFITSGNLVYSNVVAGAAKLPMDGEKLDYYIELDSRGNIKELNVTNGEYKIEVSGTSSNPVKIEEVGETIKSEVAKSGEEFTMDSMGNITDNSEQNASQELKNLNITWQRKNDYDFGNTLINYDSTKQTPEQFFNSALAKDWDYDINYYKISNTPVNSNTSYYIDISINGSTYSDILYKKETSFSGTMLDMYALYVDSQIALPVFVTTDTDTSYVYSGPDKVVNLSKGIWFIDFLASTIKSSNYLVVKEAIYNGKEKVVNGVNCLKISGNTINKDNLIGKKLYVTTKGINGVSDNNISLTEEVVTQSGSIIIVSDSFIIVPNDGIYIPTSLLNGLYEVTIKTQ